MDFYRRIQYLIDFDDMDLCIQKKPEQDLVRSRCNFVYGIHAVTVVSADLPLDSERRLGCLIGCYSTHIPCFMRICRFHHSFELYSCLCRQKIRIRGCTALNVNP